MKLLLLPLAVALLAQTPQPSAVISMEDVEDWSYQPPYPDPLNIRWATAADFDGSVPFCVGYFSGDHYELNGAGWHTDYPDGGDNFQRRLGELTKVRVGPQVVVRFDDPLIRRCPLVFTSDVGIMRLTESEVVGLRTYLQKGGFLWVDDFWGSRAWAQWTEEFARVWPTRLRPIPVDHEIRRMLYGVPEIPQIPYVGFGPGTSERGADSAEVHFFGAWDEDWRRLVAITTHNTDVGDTWEEEQHEPYFLEYSPRGYAIGINILLYALTH